MSVIIKVDPKDHIDLATVNAGESKLLKLSINRLESKTYSQYNLPFDGFDLKELHTRQYEDSDSPSGVVVNLDFTCESKAGRVWAVKIDNRNPGFDKLRSIFNDILNY